MQFWRFNQATQPVIMPCRQFLQQNNPREQRDTIANGLPAHLNGRGKFINQQPRPIASFLFG